MPKIGIIQINVPDLDKAIEWYRDILGFELSKEHYHYSIAMDLVHESCRLLLHKADKMAIINYPNVAQTLICIQTNDIVESLTIFEKNGVELIHKIPQKFPNGLFAAFRAPFGNVHELVEFRN